MSNVINGNSELSAFVENALVNSFPKIFKVNINTGEYEIFKDDRSLNVDGLDETPDIYAYIMQLITKQLVYPEYATACRRFTNPEYVRKSVFSGEKRIVQSYRRRTAKGDKWITFAIIAPPDCSPENPYVLYTWRESDSDTITLLDTLPTISSLYDKLIRINLSNGTYEPVIVDADEQERLVGGVINMYEWWAGYSKDGNIASEDMGAFGTLTKTGSLQQRFAEDPTPVNFRYRRKVGDEFRWVQIQIAPSVEYSEDNQIMLLSLKDVHEEYEAEIRSRQELIDTMNTDALTGLFNRFKFNEDMDELTQSDEPVFTCLYIDVNGLHELNNLLGHQKGDEMLCCVADTLTKHFPDDRVYRLGGDEFVVTSLKLSKGEMEQTVEKVREDLRRDSYEISVGVATGACGKNVEKIVGAAELAMRNDKDEYYMRNGDRHQKRQLNEELEQMLVEKNDSERFLNVIAHQFPGVFFVDLERDSHRYIFTPDFFPGFLEKTDSSFSGAIRIYMEKYVKPEYHSRFEAVLDYNKLEKKLSEKGSVQFSYLKLSGDRINVHILMVDAQQGVKPETLWIFARGEQLNETTTA